MTVSEYIATFSPPQKAEFERIRKIVKEMVPDVKEEISYGILTWKFSGTYLLYFAAYKKHMSLYPIHNSLLDSLKKDERGDFKINAGSKKAKATLQFTENNPVSGKMVRVAVANRLQQIISG
jgi:uncharacterized protein YdhG (YjbR/CyaY superfamily)